MGWYVDERCDCVFCSVIRVPLQATNAFTKHMGWDSRLGGLEVRYLSLLSW